jgi:hypothetical protein
VIDLGCGTWEKGSIGAEDGDEEVGLVFVGGRARTPLCK